MHHAGPEMHPSAPEDISSDEKVHHFSPAMHQTRAQRPAATPPEDAAGPRNPAAGPKWCKAGRKWCINGAAAPPPAPAVHPAGPAGCIFPPAAAPAGAAWASRASVPFFPAAEWCKAAAKWCISPAPAGTPAAAAPGAAASRCPGSFLRKARRGRGRLLLAVKLFEGFTVLFDETMTAPARTSRRRTAGVRHVRRASYRSTSGWYRGTSGQYRGRVRLLGTAVRGPCPRRTDRRSGGTRTWYRRTSARYPGTSSWYRSPDVSHRGPSVSHRGPRHGAAIEPLLTEGDRLLVPQRFDRVQPCRLSRGGRCGGRFRRPRRSLSGR